MADVEVKMVMSGFVEISNKANQAICVPMANRIAAAAGDGYRVEVTPRTAVSGWARTRVVTDTPEAMVREVTTGALARALGSA